ncbi:hypothetical protein F2P56_026834 [Juglans regia]|uniref:Reverse transcriptase domain-containing protein n=2 Tax=Juglans regia TaxID=51240 RepID=A0A833TT33_JUGRE|nr:uncharacterized protein LOC109010390 [Juglans regia]KAF5451757.1 hypothetical protein F2P56_026834 [Juglans regia]
MDEVGEGKICGVEILQEMTEKIQLIKERMKVAQDRQKSYAKYWIFQLNSKEFMTYSTYLTVKKSFGKHTLAAVDIEDISLQPNLTYEEIPIQITDSKEKELRNQKIPLVKVLW